MSRHLGRDVPDLEKPYARKLWAVKKPDFGQFPGRAARHPLNPHLLHSHLRQPKICKFTLLLGKRKRTPPCSSAELFFAEKIGSTEERFRW